MENLIKILIDDIKLTVRRQSPSIYHIRKVDFKAYPETINTRLLAIMRDHDNGRFWACHLADLADLLCLVHLGGG